MHAVTGATGEGVAAGGVTGEEGDGEAEGERGQGVVLEARGEVGAKAAETGTEEQSWRNKLLCFLVSCRA